MGGAYGLYTHIRANRIRSVILLSGFIVLLHAVLFSILLIVNAFGGGDLEDIFRAAAAQFWSTWPLAMLIALGWFIIAFFGYRAMIRAATGAHSVTRKEAPELYNLLENLCISRGITMPRLEIIETPALNAYAAGLREGDYTIAVTRGLIDRLEPAEMEAVLAHELTHIRNRDTQLMVIAVIFAGIFGFIGDLLIRRWDFPYGWSPRGKPMPDADDRTPWRGAPTGGRDDRGRGGGGGGGGAAIIAILIAVAIILISWGLSTLIRFALSRSREYLADAGSVELTKNPDAMISALRKIGQNASFDVPSRMEAFFIENPLRNRITGLLATHPSIEQRVEALVRYAAGRDLVPGS
ncbi:MAG: M48 family metallopeptidase [Hyphomicrobiaceae bacterium]